MSSKRNIGKEIIRGVQESLDYMRGKKTGAKVYKVKIKVKIPEEILHPEHKPRGKKQSVI